MTVEPAQVATSSTSSPSMRRKRSRNGERSAAHRVETHVDLTLDEDERPSGRARVDVEVVAASAGESRDQKPISKEGKDESEDQPAAPRPAISSECTICLSTMTQPATTRCGHLFCHVCISDWVKKQKK